MSRVSGLDNLDAIEILVSTEKIQAVRKFQKIPVFPLLESARSCAARRGSIRPRWVTYLWWTFWFGGCIVQNSLQNTAMLMVLLLLILLHPNKAKRCSKNFSCGLQGVPFGTKTEFKKKQICYSYETRSHVDNISWIDLNWSLV